MSQCVFTSPQCLLSYFRDMKFSAMMRNVTLTECGSPSSPGNGPAMAVEMTAKILKDSV